MAGFFERAAYQKLMFQFDHFSDVGGRGLGELKRRKSESSHRYGSSALHHHAFFTIHCVCMWHSWTQLLTGQTSSRGLHGRLL